ncbi:MAG: hypothetical protein ACTHOD_04295 [Motilibacteraceae bacterium]
MDSQVPLPRRPSSGQPAARGQVHVRTPNQPGPAGATGDRGADVGGLTGALAAVGDVAVALLDLGHPGDAVRLREANPAFLRWAGADLSPGDALPTRVVELLPLDVVRAGAAGGVVLRDRPLGGADSVQAHLAPVGAGGGLLVVTPYASAPGRHGASAGVGGPLEGLPGPQDLVRRLADRTAGAQHAAGTVVLHVRLRRSAGGAPVPVTMLEPVVRRLQDSLRAADLLVRWAPRTLGLLLSVPPGREAQVAESVSRRLLEGPGGELLEVRAADRDVLLGSTRSPRGL